MGSMMAWMMGIGLLGWVLVIGLLAAIVALLFRLVARNDTRRETGPPGESHERSQRS